MRKLRVNRTRMIELVGFFRHFSCSIGKLENPFWFVWLINFSNQLRTWYDGYVPLISEQVSIFKCCVIHKLRQVLPWVLLKTCKQITTAVFMHIVQLQKHLK